MSLQLSQKLSHSSSTNGDTSSSYSNADPKTSCRRILGAGRINKAAAPEDALTGFLEALGMQGSPSRSHQWERLVLERQEQEGNECRPQLTDLLIHRAFVFLPQVFRSPHPSLKTNPSSHKTQTHGGGWKFPFQCQPRGYSHSHSPASLEGTFQAHVPHTETPKHLVIPACDCATMPTTPATVGKGKQQRQEAEIITEFKRPLFKQYFGF